MSAWTRARAGDRQAHRAGLVASLVAGLAAPLSACPSCSVGQAIETLALVMCFMLIPYVIVSGVWLWMRRLFATEAREEREG